MEWVSGVEVWCVEWECDFRECVLGKWVCGVVSLWVGKELCVLECTK